MNNACRWPNCAAELADHHLVCDEHWSALPGFLRARIYQSGTFIDEHAAIEQEISGWVHATFSGVDERRDHGRWDRLCRVVRAKDAARAAARAATAEAAKGTA